MTYYHHQRIEFGENMFKRMRAAIAARLMIGATWAVAALASLSSSTGHTPMVSFELSNGVPRGGISEKALDMARIRSTIDSLPIRFEPNVGQTPSQVKFRALDTGYSIALTEQGARITLQRHPQKDHTSKDKKIGTHQTLTTELTIVPVRSNADPLMVGEQVQKSHSNYFIGNDPDHWHRNVVNYAAVRYKEIYPGIDWLVYGNPQQLEYDLVVAPKADPARIGFRINGAKNIALADNGDLIIATGAGAIRQLKPVIYQPGLRGSRVPVAGHYRVSDDQIAFDLGDYDHDRPLIIDPAFAYSTYLGGSQEDYATGIATDGDGNTYVAGVATSVNFPYVNPFQGAKPPLASYGTGFVSKFSADGSKLIYSTYLGGVQFIQQQTPTRPNAVAVDSSGSVYVTGYTYCFDFPTQNPFQASLDSPDGKNAFLTKLSPDGSNLIYSTYLGGSAYDSGESVAVDHENQAYVVGTASSTDFPLLHAFQSSPAGGFVTKFNAAGSGLVYSTYLGGTTGQGDTLAAVAVDKNEEVYVTGLTSSTDFPIVPGSYQTVLPTKNTASAFVTKFNSGGTSLAYSTFLGGTNGPSNTWSIDVDNTGSAYVTGDTGATDFPTVNAFELSPNSTPGASSTAFVSKLNALGTGLMYSTYLGGGLNGNQSGSSGRSIRADGAGNAYIVGYTSSEDFPIANALISTYPATAGYTGFVTEFDGTGKTLLFSSFLGGSNSDGAISVALDSKGGIHVAGTAQSADFPTVNAYQAENGSTAGTNAFVTKISQSVTQTPNIVPAGGTYSHSQLVTISDTTEGTTIYYTTDGSLPNTNSAPYTKPISVGSTMTLRAIAVATNATPISVATAAYTITPAAGGGGGIDLECLSGLIAIVALKRRARVRSR